MPVTDRGFEPMLAGQSICRRIMMMDSQYFPLDPSRQRVIPECAKEDSSAAQLFEILRSITSGEFLRTHEF
jgi:hypothetical protein